LQFCVDIVGLVPGAGEAADAFNVGVSMYRGDSEGATLSLGAMIPVGGWGPGVSKLAKDFKRIMDKTGVTDWFKGLFSKSTKVKVDSPSYGEVVDDVAENADAAKVTDQAASGVTRTLDDLSSIKGASWEEAESMIPEGWIRGKLNKGEGIKFVNPAKKGEQILLEKGWPGAKDPLHSGPYMKISKDGQVTRIPLQGNPTLK
jgi:hypothetical protein